MKIMHIQGREIYDSRGLPTVECVLVLEDGSYVQASVPSGLSTGSYEAVELRDGDATRLMGLGVQQAIENLEKIIAPVLVGREPSSIEMDVELVGLDGTQDKSSLGANAMLAASIAVIRAQAIISDIELYELIAYLMDFKVVTLPFPLFNVINGGVHAPNNVDIQEILVMPVGFERFSEALQATHELFYVLKDIVKAQGKHLIIGDEGGVAPDVTCNKQALDFLMQALAASNHTENFKIGLDIAANQLYNKQTKKYRWDGNHYSAEHMQQIYTDLCKNYPIYSIEDAFAEDDWQAWVELMGALGESIQIVGDDLFATNPHRIAQGIELQAANASIIKPNQIGTVTEALQAIKLCQTYELNPIISHRSGETEDNFIVDLAVGANVGQFKGGGCERGESVTKYNELLRIEEELLARQFSDEE